MGISAGQGIGSVKAGVCTSSTRPSNPYEGQQIYETDTDKILVWNGTAWYANWNTAWGNVGYVFSTGGWQTLTTTIADISGASVSFTAVSGRLYKVTYNAIVQKISTTGTVNITITDSSNTTLFNSFSTITTNLFLNYSLSTVLTGLSGSVTIKARGATGSGSANLFRDTTYPTSFVVEDIGPA